MIDENFSEHYSLSGLTTKVSSVASTAAAELIRTVITLYVILEQPSVPVIVKATVVAALGYFICPIDLIPDFLPGGFIYDLAVLTATLRQVCYYSNKDVKERVEELIPEWSKIS